MSDTPKFTASWDVYYTRTSSDEHDRMQVDKGSIASALTDFHMRAQFVLKLKPTDYKIERAVSNHSAKQTFFADELPRGNPDLTGVEIPANIQRLIPKEKTSNAK